MLNRPDYFRAEETPAVRKARSVVVCVVLAAGCTGGSFALRPSYEEVRDGFVHRVRCNAACDLGKTAEEDRLRALDALVRSRGTCPHGYAIQRREALGTTYTSPPNLIVYEGRCHPA